MFGYIVTDRAQLTETEQQLYRGYYCGLCETLSERYGTAARMAISYDMTFLNILLTALYEPQAAAKECRCVLHPLKKRTHIVSVITDYCADMTVLLAYYNAMDDWTDDKNLAARTYAAALKSAAERAKEKHPEKAAAIESAMSDINTLERQQTVNLDAVAARFGQMMAEIFAYQRDVWSEKLKALGQNLGEFIYFMDAWEDADKDARHKNYNPLLPLKEQPDYEQKCKDILMMFLSASAQVFEALPVVGDEAKILRNILYAGVWSRYSIKQSKEKKHG